MGLLVPYIDAFNSILSNGALVYIFIGVLLGLIFGAIPGLTAVLAVVILIPFTYEMDTISGLAMLIGAFIGGVSGGCVSAVLLGMPGTPASFTTSLDGFPLAKRGEGGRALGTSIYANLAGSLIGLVVLVTIAPQLAKIALKFGAYEYTMIILFGLTTVVSLSGKSIFKGILVGLLGLCLASIGYDPINGSDRSIFGFLGGGIAPIPAMIGLFVVSQIYTELENFSKTIIPVGKIGRILPNLKEIKDSPLNVIRSSLIGIGIGILPGIGGSLANILAYDQAKKSSKHPETFGKGNIEGVIASESANNATIGGALIPLLTLGIPGDAVTAMLLGGLQIKGLQPGPRLFIDQAPLMYGIYVSFFIATIMMVVLMFFGIRFFVKVLAVPKAFLLPLVMIMSLTGSYNIRFSVGDIWVAVIFGILGYGLYKFSFPILPLVITIILGPMFEGNLRVSLMLSQGNLLPFLTRPISLVLIIATIFTVFLTTKKLRTEKIVA